MSKVEIRLEGMSNALAILTASQAEMRGELGAEIKAIQDHVTRLDGKFTAFQSSFPTIVAEVMREVQRENRADD